MKTQQIILGTAILPFLVACGGGASTSTTSTTSTITGTVPGTLIEAFCSDGTYKQVTSTNNGTSEHPFSITVPKSTACKLVMTMNENNSSNRIINNIGFDDNTVQGTSLKVDNDLDLGNIPLPTTYATVSDTDNNHVNDDILYVSNSTGTISTTAIQDSDNNGVIDAYDDKDNDGLVNAYEDDNGDGTPNIHEDKNHDGTPDFIEDDNKNGRINFLDDSDGNGRPDYADDSNGDGVENHLENGNDDG